MNAQKDAEIHKQQKQITQLTRRIAELKSRDDQIQKRSEQMERLKESQRTMTALIARIEARNDSVFRSIISSFRSEKGAKGG